MKGDNKHKKAMTQLKSLVETIVGDLATRGIESPDSLDETYRHCKAWLDYVRGVGNQCAYTDSVLDRTVESARTALSDLKAIGHDEQADSLEVLLKDIQSI